MSFCSSTEGGIFSNTIEAKDTERRELYNLAGNIPFDDRVCYNAEIADLKLNLIREYLGSVKSDLYDRVNDIPKELLCRQMNIVEGSQEYIKPKNIGILCSAIIHKDLCL